MNGLYNIWTVIILAYLIGSFLNVVIYRLPIILKLQKKTYSFKKFNLALPRSHCPHCQKTLYWWHNIPLLSFLLLRGKCYFCYEKISKRYFIIELSYIFLIALCFYQSSEISDFIALSLFTTLALIIFFIDLETMFIPDILNFVLLWSGLIVNSFAIFSSLHHAVYGAVFGYLGLWSLYHLIFWTTNKQGFGYGDFKLLAAIGAWLGVFQLLNTLFIGSILGLILALFKRKKISEPLPFGPPLCLAAFLILVFPEQFNWSYLLF